MRGHSNPQSPQPKKRHWWNHFKWDELSPAEQLLVGLSVLGILLLAAGAFLTGFGIPGGIALLCLGVSIVFPGIFNTWHKYDQPQYRYLIEDDDVESSTVARETQAASRLSSTATMGYPLQPNGVDPVSPAFPAPPVSSSPLRAAAPIEKVDQAAASSDDDNNKKATCCPFF